MEERGPRGAGARALMAGRLNSRRDTAVEAKRVRAVCALGEVFNCGLGLRGRHYVRAKDLKWSTTTLRYWRFETRFFASFLFAFEKK
jgi:hypothetical protein